MKQTNEWEKKTKIKAKDCVVILYIDGGKPEEKGLTTVDISRRIWRDIEKYKKRPTPSWVKDRVKWRMTHLKKQGYSKITNGAEGNPGLINIWNLTNSGEDYARYHYKNSRDDLLLNLESESKI